MRGAANLPISSAPARVNIRTRDVKYICCGPNIFISRMLEPPGRSSMWRVGFPTPKVREYNEEYSGLDGDIWGDATADDGME